MRSLLAGSNPATAIHDGTANRQPKPVTETAPITETTPLAPCQVPTIDLTPETAEETVEDEVEQTEDMTAEEYAEALIEVRLEKLALAVARKVLTDAIPGKFFVYGSGGMNKRNGKLLREQTEQDIQDYVPNVYALINKVAQRLLAASPARPERLLTCPSCRNQAIRTIKPLHATNGAIARYHCTRCGCKTSERYFKHLRLMQPSVGETPVQPEPTNPKARARKKKETSPAGMVNVDELPPEARARVMAQIEQAGAIQ